MHDAVVGFVGSSEALDVGLGGVLQFDPAEVQLSFEELEPEEVSEETLVLGNGSFVED